MPCMGYSDGVLAQEGVDILPASVDVSCAHALGAAAVELDAQAREATAALQVRASLFDVGWWLWRTLEASPAVLLCVYAPACAGPGSGRCFED